MLHAPPLALIRYRRSAKRPVGPAIQDLGLLVEKNWCEAAALSDFELRGPGGCGHIRVVIFVDTRGEGAGTDGILGAQAVAERNCIAGRDGIEVQNGLGRSEAEFLEPAAFQASALVLI